MNHLPMYGDGVEAWLKAKRDEYVENCTEWAVIDDLVNDYLVRADEGQVMVAPE